MAVTFYQQPSDYQTSDNPLIYNFGSNKTGQPNFSFIVKTYINAILVSTERIFPKVSGRSKWDASVVVKNAIYTPKRPTALYEDINLPEIYVTITENYGSTPTDHSIGTSSTISIIKAKLSEEDFKTINIGTDYVDAKFLTNVPDRIIHATKQQDVFLQYISTDTIQKLFIDAYDIDGNYINTYTSPDNPSSLWNMNLSYDNIFAVFPAIATAYELQVYINSSETIFIRYDIADCDNKDVLSWINKFGAFDQFVFTHYQENRASVESQSYNRQFGGWDGSDYSFDNEYGEIETVKIKKPTGYIVSGWITPTIQNWLVSLYDSIGVRLNNEQNIKITSSSYTVKTNRFDELINEEITYQLTTTKSIMI